MGSPSPRQEGALEQHVQMPPLDLEPLFPSYLVEWLVLRDSPHAQVECKRILLLQRLRYYFSRQQLHSIPKPAPQVLVVLEVAHRRMERKGMVMEARRLSAWKEAQERATENATFNFTKRRGIAGEIKQYKEQKNEAERFEALVQERVSESFN